jgi:cold-inducible RNA-binding protein
MSNRLFIRNLNPATTETELHDLFSTVGRVDQIVLPTNHRTGESKGSCVIDMATDELARSAIRKLNGHVLHDQPVHVAATRPPNLRASPF